MSKNKVSVSSARWLKEHFDDEYVKKAQRLGLRSRAVFKIEEINNKDKLRLDCLQNEGPPILIIQGTRDKFGSINEVNNLYLNENKAGVLVDIRDKKKGVTNVG